MGGSMLAIAIVAAAAGLVLGLRFSVIALALLMFLLRQSFLPSEFGVAVVRSLSHCYSWRRLPLFRSVISLAACLLHIFLREQRWSPTASKCDIYMVCLREQ